MYIFLIVSYVTLDSHKEWQFVVVSVVFTFEQIKEFTESLDIILNANLQVHFEINCKTHFFQREGSCCTLVLDETIRTTINVDTYEAQVQICN